MEPTENNILLLEKLLTHYGWKRPRTEIRKILTSHPNYPCLKAFGEAMDIFHIPYEAYRTDYSSLLQTHTPVIVHLDIREGRFALLVAADTEKVTFYIPETGRKVSLSKELFLQQWKGVVFAIDKAPTDIPKKFFTRKNRSVLTGSLFAALLFTVYGLYFLPALPSLCALGINLIGLASSLIIIGHEWGKNLGALHRFCRLTKKNRLQRRSFLSRFKAMEQGLSGRHRSRLFRRMHFPRAAAPLTGCAPDLCRSPPLSVRMYVALQFVLAVLPDLHDQKVLSVLPAMSLHALGSLCVLLFVSGKIHPVSGPCLSFYRRLRDGGFSLDYLQTLPGNTGKKYPARDRVFTIQKRSPYFFLSHGCSTLLYDVVRYKRYPDRRLLLPCHRHPADQREMHTLQKADQIFSGTSTGI